MDRNHSISIAGFVFLAGLAFWVLCAVCVHTSGNSLVTTYAYRFSESMMLVGGTLYTLLRSRLARTTHSNSVAEQAYLSNYSAQIDHIAKRLRKLNVARWIVAIVLAISSAFLISCPGLALPLTSLMHWAPNTQYLVPAYPGYSAWLIIPALVGFLALFALIGECLLLHIARSEPIAFRRAFQDEVLVRTSKRRDDIALLVLLGVFSVAGVNRHAIMTHLRA